MPGSSHRLSIELAIAAALEKAAAAGGMCIRSCKLAGASFDSTAVLQALPGSTLTSLDLDLQTPEKATASETQALMGRLSTVLPSLQQLQRLRLHDATFYDHDITWDAVLSGFSALTNLTHVNLPEVGSKQCSSCSTAQHNFKNFFKTILITTAVGTVCRTSHSFALHWILLVLRRLELSAEAIAPYCLHVPGIYLAAHMMYGLTCTFPAEICCCCTAAGGNWGAAAAPAAFAA
jgi:hypothetical protein